MSRDTWTRSLRALTEPECRLLLAASQFGRLAITRHALPALMPVRLEVIDDYLLIAPLVEDALPLGVRSVAALETGGLGEGIGREWTVEACGVLEPHTSLTLAIAEEPISVAFRLSGARLRGWCSRRAALPSLDR